MVWRAVIRGLAANWRQKLLWQEGMQQVVRPEGACDFGSNVFGRKTRERAQAGRKAQARLLLICRSCYLPDYIRRLLHKNYKFRKNLRQLH